jgi:hypothetical protein
MCVTEQTRVHALVDFGRMKLYVLLPKQNGALPELQLAMESNDRDALKQVAHELAQEIPEIHEPRWTPASGGGEERLLVHGHCCFLIRE